MTPSLWRSALAGLAAFAVPVLAWAQASGCPAQLSNAAYDAALSPEAAQMRCDIERAATIRERAQKLYGVRFDSLIEIIDTASPSGATYVYDVSAEGGALTLDARSVPDGQGPLCRLKATLPRDTAQAVSGLLIEASAGTVPDYGPREDVTHNPDGSRSVRLVIDSHDIITRAQTSSGIRNFSRHAGSDDPVNRLNNLVIGIANVSPGWACSAS